MARLYEGMEIPDRLKKQYQWNGAIALMILSDGQPEQKAEKYRQALEKIGISLLVLKNEDIIAGMTDEEHSDAFFLVDEKGKILLAQYGKNAADLPGPEETCKAAEETVHPVITAELLESILDAYPYEIVYVDRHHVVRYMNAVARRRYGERVQIGCSLFNCHNERSREKILAFLKRADAGENEMFETYNQKTGEREFFVPVRNRNGHVIGYFERHEAPWNRENAEVSPGITGKTGSER